MGSNPSSSWEGVSCYAGRVVGVNLQSQGASGSLENFGRLTGLTYLWLSNNSFSGDSAYIPRPLSVKHCFCCMLCLPRVSTYTCSSIGTA